jgi:hypothetical protein
MNTQTISPRLSSVRNVSVQRSATPAPAPRGQEAMAATIAILQRELMALQAELQVLEVAAPQPVKVRLETEQQEAILSALRDAPPSGLWLPELQERTGLSKNVTHTRAQQLAYARRIDYSKEPGPSGKLTVRLRLPEYVAKEY